MKSIIVIPTYNEVGNLEKLISDIFSLNIPDLSVIIVDDNSPDGTGELAEDIKKNRSQISVIHRLKKTGLGSAYAEGFKLALQLGADYIFEMDADFSHDYKYLPIFFREIKEADLVVGSRYIKGGKIESWGIGRRLISYLGNIYAKIVLSCPITDLTGGFKCYRREVLARMNLDQFDSQGYAFQIETTYFAFKNNFKIKEVPIVFQERIIGKSKFNFKIFFEAFILVLLLSRKKSLLD